jgi:hypothetical protein
MGICNILVAATLFFHIIGSHGGAKQINVSLKTASRDETHWPTNLVHAPRHVSTRHKRITMSEEGSLKIPCDCHETMLNRLRGGTQTDQDLLAEVATWSTNSVPETLSNAELVRVKAESSDAREASSDVKGASEDDTTKSPNRVVSVSVLNNSEMNADNNNMRKLR